MLGPHMCALKDTGSVMVRVVSLDTIKAFLDTGLPMVEVIWWFWADGGVLTFWVCILDPNTFCFCFSFCFVCVWDVWVCTCLCVCVVNMFINMHVEAEVSVGCLPLSFVSCLIFDLEITDLAWLAAWLCLCPPTPPPPPPPIRVLF